MLKKTKGSDRIARERAKEKTGYSNGSGCHDERDANI